eukprot:9669079-Lingulodinium_polyedra.AAC.1
MQCIAMFCNTIAMQSNTHAMQCNPMRRNTVHRNALYCIARGVKQKVQVVACQAWHRVQFNAR